ncbi:MAG: hypothetical protein RLW87_01665 [Alphaproteobacteria bacterium]|jgi:hypothetical protein|uniref:hypothetical protein n=1 Tax=Pacificispira sp. TaxID=2888761 RepID=UPI001B2F476B|nr:hypothetical protein [Alphaproteobacteria bacterium]MBO6862371.1 hypothetical protein [Alphaproteobacteria bacterium]MEC9268911.1 hypothetical protein [Pseudomonadota bacterium]
MICDLETTGTPRVNFAEEQKRKVMTLFLDAWDEACAQGIPSELLSEVCLYLALTDLVEDHGEDDVADIIETLPYRIRTGEFTMEEERH